MSSVPFLHFPSLIQWEIVKRMDVRELIKFSFCSKRSHKIIKSCKLTIDYLYGSFDRFEGLEMKFSQELNNKSEYRIELRDMEDENDEEFPEYTGFGGLQMYDESKDQWRESDLNGVVMLPEGRNFTKTCDKVMGHLSSLFESFTEMIWFITPELRITKCLKKHFPKIRILEVSKDGDVMTGKEANSLMELNVERLRIACHVKKESYKYSKGFQSKGISIEWPSWVHWDAIFNSRSEEIVLTEARSLTSANLNRFLKLWVSNEKMQKLTCFYFRLKSDGPEFPSCFFEMILDGIPTAEPSIPQQREITRVDGKVAKVKVVGNEFSFKVTP